MTGPYDYNTGDLYVRGAPLVFLFIAVGGTLYIQSMQLGSQYGKDAKLAMEGDLKQKLTMDQVDPRMLAWFQSGKGWQKFMKYDTAVMEPFVRQWKMWTLAGLGFPIRSDDW